MTCTRCNSKNTQKFDPVFSESMWQFYEACNDCGYGQWKPENRRNDPEPTTRPFKGKISSDGCIIED